MISTTHLTLRRLTVNDAPFIFELLNTPNWKKFIGDRNINTLHDAGNYILTMQNNFYDKYNYGLLLVSLKGNDGPIGLCGLIKRDYLDSPDIGFAFLPGYEGKGYAYESSMAIIDDAIKNHAITKLYAITTDKNIRSQNLLERCGLSYEKDIEIPTDEVLRLYQLIL